MGLLDWFFGSKPPKLKWKPPAKEPLHLARGRGHTFDVVGESHSQDVFDDICGGKREDGHKLKVTAQLCFVEDNPHDPNAVGVFIEGQLVGYVPRDAAPQLREDILRINREERPVTCDGKIVGGWDRGHGDEGHYGLKLSLSDPLKLKK